MHRSDFANRKTAAVVEDGGIFKGIRVTQQVPSVGVDLSHATLSAKGLESFLLKNKKLLLVLDIDHTLLHATHDRR